MASQRQLRDRKFNETVSDLVKNIDRYKVFQKYFMLTQEEVIGRLIDEEEAKNKANRFIVYDN